MKNIIGLSLGLMLMTVLVACGGGTVSQPFGQDPLSGYPESVRNGLPPEVRPSKPDLAGVCKDC
jgi:hypothetical protein